MRETLSVKRSFLSLRGIVWIAALLLPSYQLSAQAPSAESIFDSLTCGFVAEMARPLNRIEGPSTERLKACVKTDTTAAHYLVISSPQMIVERMNKTTVKRRLSFTAEVRDSLSGIVKEFEYSDSLPLSELKKIPKAEQEWLRTEDPRAVHRLWLPLALVAAGVVGIITLFYLRS